MDTTNTNNLSPQGAHNPEEEKREVPADLCKQLHTAITDHTERAEARDEAGDNLDAKYHLTAAEYLKSICFYLERGDSQALTMASVQLWSARDNFQREVPQDVVDFLTKNNYSAKTTPLAEMFSAYKTLKSKA